MKYLKVEFTESEIKRINNKISVDPKTNCWNWAAAKVKGRGYGVFNFRGDIEMVHRLMYAYRFGPIPKGMSKVIDHIVCNNRACCNPEHLKLGSQKKNALRGDSPPSVNSRKTHCINGHEFPKKPNEFWGNGRRGRRCVICRRARALRRYHERMSGPERQKLIAARKIYWKTYSSKH